MDWDLMTKAVLATLGIFGPLLGWMNWRTTQQLGVHKLGETELDALGAGIEDVGQDPAYQRFLKNLQKEKLVSLAFGCPVPLARELGRLMAYHERGFATTGQIRPAWAHRNPPGNPLSFALGRSEKVQFWLAVVYLALCLLAGSGLTVLALLPPWKATNLSAAGVAACYLAFAWLDFRVHRSLFVADELSKRERGGEADFGGCQPAAFAVRVVHAAWTHRVSESMRAACDGTSDLPLPRRAMVLGMPRLPLPSPSPQLLAEFLLWRQALAQAYPAGPQAWFDQCAERWFLALLELEPGRPLDTLWSLRISEGAPPGEE